MHNENLKNLIECLIDLSEIQIDIDSMHFFVRDKPIDFNELTCQIFDDTGLQDIIDEHLIGENFPNTSPQVIQNFISSFNNFVKFLSEKRKIYESLDSLRTSTIEFYQSLKL